MSIFLIWRFSSLKQNFDILSAKNIFDLLTFDIAAHRKGSRSTIIWIQNYNVSNNLSSCFGSLFGFNCCFIKGLCVYTMAMKYDTSFLRSTHSRKKYIGNNSKLSKLITTYFLPLKQISTIPWVFLVLGNFKRRNLTAGEDFEACEQKFFASSLSQLKQVLIHFFCGCPKLNWKAIQNFIQS